MSKLNQTKFIKGYVLNTFSPRSRKSLTCGSLKLQSTQARRLLDTPVSPQVSTATRSDLPNKSDCSTGLDCK